MTQEFKNNILAYLVGKLDIETPTDTSPEFTNISQKQNNLKTQITAQIGDTYFIDGMLQSNTSNITVLYGNDTEKTFFVLLNETFDVIQIITTYENGSNIDLLKTMNIADDGTFYGTTADYKFVMLTNFTIKTAIQTSYTVKKRYTTDISTALAVTSGEPIGIKKSPTSATYIIYGNQIYTYQGNPYRKPAGTILKVNVGESNKLINYTSLSSTTGTNTFVKDASLFEDDDTFSFILQCAMTQAGSTLPVYKEWSGVKDEGQTTIAMTSGREVNLLGGNASNLVLKSIGNDIYIAYNDDIEEKYYIDYISEETGSYSDPIFGEPLTQNLGGFQLINKGSLMFFLLNKHNGTDYSSIVGLINKKRVFSYESGNHTNEPTLFVNSTFNLINFYLQDDDNVYRTQTVYNQFNYNGKSYIDINSMVPNSGILYNENNEMVFARNLYNKSANGNTTISTIEVPNTYLNDTNISKEDLKSETNSILNQSTEAINKNIYETLNINWINTLIMKNSNDPQNEIINTIGASKLNISISSTNDYEETQIRKFKVNYEDGTNRLFKIDKIEYLQNMAILDMFIYVSKPITNIQIISGDESVVYQEITGLQLEVGKFYNLTQNVEII
mgnify:CR=1 FL=1